MSADRALGLVASMVLEDGRTWGEAALPAQIADARAILDLDGPRRHFLTRPRGGSKSSDLAAVILAAMVVQAPIGAQLYCAAADRDQAALVLSAMRGWVARTPALSGLFDFTADRVTLESRAVTFTVLPADSAGAWGLRPWMVTVDEIAQHPDTRRAHELFEALVSAMPKVAGSRLVLLTTAGSPLHWSYPVWLEAADAKRWRRSEWTAADGLAPVPWQDVAEMDEMRRALPEASFRRLFLNEWCGADEQFIDEARLAAITRPTAETLRHDPTHRYVVSLDVGVTGDRTAVAVSHLENRRDENGPHERFVVVDHLASWSGSRRRPVQLAQVEREVERLARRYRGRVVNDPYQSVGMAQGLSDRGLSVEAFNFSAASKQKLASTAIQLVRDAHWVLPNDPLLREEMLGLRVVERASGQFYLDHPAGGHDDLFTACVLGAHWQLENQPRHATVTDYIDHRGRRDVRDETDPLRFGGLDERAFIKATASTLGRQRGMER